MLEDRVDEKYFISENMMNYFMGVNQKPSKFPRRERFLANINRKDQDRANSITTNQGNRPTDNFVKVDNSVKPSVAKSFCIRKLTPKECWRLMGFDDSDLDKAEKVNSNTQLYKQAGNSIVVNVLEAILNNLLGGEYGTRVE